MKRSKRYGSQNINGSNLQGRSFTGSTAGFGGFLCGLVQIEEKQYETDLIARGYKEGQIRKYGFAFAGKEVLIGEE